MAQILEIVSALYTCEIKLLKIFLFYVFTNSEASKICAIIIIYT